MIDKIKLTKHISFFFSYRWPVDETKREAAGTEECRRIDAMFERLIKAEPLLYRGRRVGLQ